MGQKVNPLGIRLGITRDWTSIWYAGKKQFPAQCTPTSGARVPEGPLRRGLGQPILVERAAKKVNITIQTARPGIVIGKQGEEIEKLRQETPRTGHAGQECVSTSRRSASPSCTRSWSPRPSPSR